MTTESQSLDITNEPQLSRLVDEVRKAKRPQVWRRANEDMAMLVPLAPQKHATITPVPYNPALAAVLAGLPEDDPFVRTAGALHTDHSPRATAYIPCIRQRYGAAHCSPSVSRP